MPEFLESVSSKYASSVVGVIVEAGNKSAFPLSKAQEEATLQKCEK